MSLHISKKKKIMEPIQLQKMIKSNWYFKTNKKSNYEINKKQKNNVVQFCTA